MSDANVQSSDACARLAVKNGFFYFSYKANNHNCAFGYAMSSYDSCVTDRVNNGASWNIYEVTADCGTGDFTDFQ